MASKEYVQDDCSHVYHSFMVVAYMYLQRLPDSALEGEDLDLVDRQHQCPHRRWTNL